MSEFCDKTVPKYTVFPQKPKGAYKELIKKGEDEVAGKFPKDSLFFSKQRLEEGRRWKVKRKLIMTIKNQDLTLSAL